MRRPTAAARPTMEEECLRFPTGDFTRFVPVWQPLGVTVRLRIGGRTDPLGATIAVRASRRSQVSHHMHGWRADRNSGCRRELKPMRASLFLLFSCLPLLAACGSSHGAGSPAGVIAFGTSESNHVVHHPTSSFGPDDTVAYVARVNHGIKIAPRAKITEYFSRIGGNGKEQTVLQDSFARPAKYTDYITFSGVTVSNLYVVGFTAPGRYRVRLVSGGVKLAEGTFSLK